MQLPANHINTRKLTESIFRISSGLFSRMARLSSCKKRINCRNWQWLPPDLRIVASVDAL